eukprot:scaffold2045_cov404-Prasinococcus_capsulatus_cf.AAC.16
MSTPEAPRPSISALMVAPAARSKLGPGPPELYVQGGGARALSGGAGHAAGLMRGISSSATTRPPTLRAARAKPALPRSCRAAPPHLGGRPHPPHPAARGGRRGGGSAPAAAAPIAGRASVRELRRPTTRCPLPAFLPGLAAAPQPPLPRGRAAFLGGYLGRILCC